MHENIGIIGCGLIGASWAGLFLATGRNIHAWDPSAPTRSGFADKASAIADELENIGLFATTTRGSLQMETDAGAVARATSFIQENAPEDVATKRTLYRELEQAAATATIIASSTSSLVWSDLAAGMTHPNRLITAHPFNPPHLMPLVEIYGPDAAIVDDAVHLYRDLGRYPVRLKKEAVGHIANRLASALWREAVNIVAEDIADVADVDAALVHGPGLRWSVVGAHMAYHLGGGPGGIAHYLAHLGPSQERRWATLGQPTLTPDVCQKITDGIAREAGGRSIAELEAQRDRALVAALKARKTVGQ